MDIKTLEETLRANIQKDLKDGLTLKRGSFGNGKRTFCAISANNFMRDKQGVWIGVEEREVELKLPKNALWEVVHGFDGACLIGLSPYGRLGRKLAKEFLK